MLRGRSLTVPPQERPLRTFLGRTLVVAVALLVVLGSCRATHKVDRRLVAADELTTADKRSPFLKVHLSSGNVAILARWSVDGTQRVVRGTGDVLDVNRRSIVREQGVELGADSIVLAETNVVRTSGATNFLTALSVVSGVGGLPEGLDRATLTAAPRPP